MRTIDKQLLSLKDYPAKLIIGRMTESGVLVVVDGRTLNSQSRAAQVIEQYESLNEDGLEYRYEVVAIDDVEMKEAEMRLSLQKEAHDKGLPTGDWE